MGKVVIDGKEIKRVGFKEIVRRVGPGLILTGVVIGPGNITMSAMLGANYGYAMAIITNYIHGCNIYVSVLSLGYAKWYANYSCYTSLLW